MGFTFPGVLYSSEAPGEVPKVHTPASGNVERKVLLDAIRAEVKEMHGLDVIFVVKEMNVSDGWAWVHALPRSRDGSCLYEDLYALLRREKSEWMVAEMPCTEPDNSECIDSPDYFRNIVARYPDMPVTILPKESARD
ncbi:MAG: hypothetical protein HGB00_06925 [Chlorobiaceae bacterium]|nr:hypothetical protein [Chlorobiaceae bacterium]